MLDEQEFARVSPYLFQTIREIKNYRELTGAGLADANKAVTDRACEEFENLTGYKESNYLAIYHHRLSNYGPPCSNCGNLLRTPRARFCALCGTVAGADDAV
jgi:hypothetical protein